MDLYSANAAHSLHADQARRTARELEYRRIATERAAELTSNAIGETPAKALTPRVRHGVALAALFHGRARAAQ